MTLVRLTIEVESPEDAIRLLDSERAANMASLAAEEFSMLMRNRIKYQDHSETEMKLLEDVRTDFCRIFEDFLPE